MDQTSKAVQRHRWNIFEIYHLSFLFLKVRNLNQISLLLDIPAEEVDDMIEQLNLFEIFEWESFCEEEAYLLER